VETPFAKRMVFSHTPRAMKNPIVFCGALVLILNAAAPFCPDPRGHLAAQIASVLLGAAIAILAIRRSPTPAAPAAVLPPRPEAEIVAFLALLQEHGRLVDFAKEDIGGASDQQLGSAARVVHAGCRKVLDEYFEITPLRSEKEGAPVTLEQGYDTTAHRLLGSVPDRPPFQGKILHPGWVSRSVKLPRLAAEPRGPWPVIAPAEIEVRN
jgi:hypothetical protein